MRYMLLFVVTILVTFNFRHAHAVDACSYVNLTDPGKPMEKMPVYDQVGDICFNYTAVQVYDATRIALGDKSGLLSDPSYLAVDGAYRRGHKDLQQGGEMCVAYENLRTFGACSQQSMPKGSESRVHELIAFFNENKKLSAAEFKQLYEQKFKRQENQYLDWEMALRKDNPLFFARMVFTTQCATRNYVHAKVPKCVMKDDDKTPSSEFRKMVDASLSTKNPLPVEIGYSKNIFSYNKSPESYTIKREKMNESDFIFKYQPHSSLIIGRRKNDKGICQYLLRNTMGKSFCPEAIVKERGWECAKNGDVWIHADFLMDSTFQVSYVNQNDKNSHVKKANGKSYEEIYGVPASVIPSR
jgi:hypothetical protein